MVFGEHGPPPNPPESPPAAGLAHNKLWEALGEPLGVSGGAVQTLWEALREPLGAFGEPRGTLGELWEALYRRTPDQPHQAAVMLRANRRLIVD